MVVSDSGEEDKRMTARRNVVWMYKERAGPDGKGDRSEVRNEV